MAIPHLHRRLPAGAKPLLSLTLLFLLSSAKLAAAEEKDPTTEEEADLGGLVVDADPDDDSIYLDPAITGDDVIVVWGARPEKVFERDTRLRLTGAELKKRGINNLADALDLLPEIYVRAAGRGGRQIDVRGARKGSVKILLDGIAISDPYYGNIDLSAIPVTDIEQIRVSASPASPIDGPGGPGGVIEVLTTDAVGESSVRARITGTTLPSAELAATGRTMLSEHLAARVSVSAVGGAEEFELVPMGASDSTFLPEDRQQSVAAVRIEYREGERRLVTDIWTQQVAYVVPPAQDLSSNILVIDGESQGRLGMAYDDEVQGFKVQTRAHYHLLGRKSTYYEDAALTMRAQSEDLSADRSGLAVLVNRPVGRHWQLLGAANLESDHADVEGFDGQHTEGRATVAQSALGAQLEEGPLTVQASAGVAVPIGLSADPWLELKLAAKYQPIKAVTFKLIGGHKGRTPTLRERYRLDIGNESLGPEKALFGELGASVSPSSHLRLSLSGYQRLTNGLIRFDSEQRSLINTEDLRIRGIDAQLEGKLSSWLSGGGSWSFADAHSEVLGPDPLDFFPKHRLSSWLRTDFERGGATLRLQYVGAQIDKNVELDPRLLVQLGVHARFADHYLFSLRGENLSGQIYEQRLGVLAPGRVFFASVQSEWK